MEITEKQMKEEEVEERIRHQEIEDTFFSNKDPHLEDKVVGHRINIINIDSEAIIADLNIYLDSIFVFNNDTNENEAYFLEV